MHSRLRTWIAAALLVPALAAPAAAEDGWWDTEPRVVPFERILEDPVAYLDVTVVITLQFDRRHSLFNPFYTAFTPDRYANFSAWPDTAELWDRDQFMKPFPYFFIPRAHPAAEALKETAPRTRLACKAMVRSVFRGDPWIEITAVSPQAEAVGPATVKAAFRGIEAYDRGDLGEAMARFHEALATNPGSGPSASLWRRIAHVHWKRQELAEAKAALAKCLAVNPADADGVALASTIEAAEKRLLAVPVPDMPGIAPPKKPVAPAGEPLNPKAPAAPKAEPVPAPQPAPKPEPKAAPAPAPKPEPAPAPKAEPKPAPAPAPEVKKPVPPPAPEEEPPPAPAPDDGPKKRPVPPR